MEGQEFSFDILLENRSQENESMSLSEIRKCIFASENETEVLQAVKVALCVCLKQISVNELDNLFSLVCPAAKDILLNKMKCLESDKKVVKLDGWNLVEKYSQLLTTSLEIVSYFQSAFENLRKAEKMAVLQVGNLLTNSVEVLHACYTHFGMSEELYGSDFTSLADCLSGFFKKCCDVQEQLLNFLTEKLVLTFNDNCDTITLNKILSYLSKSGIALISLDVKTMAKVWKAYLSLVEKYASHLKNTHNVGTTVNSLSTIIISNGQNISKNLDDQTLNKLIKLSCFLLKVLIKICEIFTGFLHNCHKSLLDVLLSLCRYNVLSFKTTKIQKTGNEDLINQLALGCDPLLSPLLTDVELIKQCSLVDENLSLGSIRNVAFPILCCLVLKKLMNVNTSTRSLWFNEENNILDWLFLSLYSPNSFYVNHNLPGFLVEGKQKQCTDLYEYILVNTSAFLMTSTSVEFIFIENILIKYVLQSNPWRAIFATDIWCLLARFADSQLCFSQVSALSKILQSFEPQTLRIEKRYLIALIRRLFPLMTQSQKESFLRSYKPAFYSLLWEGHETYNEISNFNSHTLKEINHSILNEAKHSFGEEEDIFVPAQLYIEKSLLKCDVVTCQKLESLGQILWSFDSQQLLSNSQANGFLKIACLVAATIVSYISPEDLFLILNQTKKLLTCRPSSCIKLYFTLIVNSLSTVSISSCEFQRAIVQLIAEIFRELLSSSEVMVKQKALEVFYRFSHVTTHSEIIALIVHNCSSLKQEITNYFQKKPLPLDLDLYLAELGEPDVKHCCSVGVRTYEWGDEEPDSKKIKTKDTGNVQEVYSRWKKDGEKLTKLMTLLTSSEKKELTSICNSIIILASQSI